MLSVLILSPDPAVPGGVSVFIETVKRHLRRSRASAFWVGAPGDAAGTRSGLADLWRLIAAPLTLVQRVRAERPDVVHLNPSFDTKSLIRDGLFLLALRLAGHRRTLVFFHGWDWNVHRAVLRIAPLRHLLAWLLNGVPVTTVLGDAFRDGLIALGVAPDRVIISRTSYEPLPVAPVAPPARPTILFLSRFDREKGGRELIAAFAALAADYPAFDLVMAGKGADEAALHALAASSTVADRIRFPGYTTGAAKTALLQTCTIFALPTYYRSEGLPVAMLEAMGAGKPVLLGPAGAIASVARDGEHGVVLDHVSVASVTEGLRRLLADPAFAARAGAAGRALAESGYTAEAVTAQIETLYDRVAAC